MYLLGAGMGDGLGHVAVAAVVGHDERAVEAEALLQSEGEFRAGDNLRLDGDNDDVLFTGLLEVLDHAGT